MRLIENISVKSKLILMVCVMLIFSILIGLIGVLGLVQTNELDEELYEEQLIPMENISHLIENLLVASSSFDMAILSGSNLDEVESYRASVEELNRDTQALISKYRDFVPENAQLNFDSAVKIFDEVFLPTSPTVFEKLLAGDVEGADVIMGGIDVKIKEMVDHFGACKDANINSAAEKRTQNESLSTTMIILQVSIFSVSILVVVVLSVLITQSISKPMLSLTKLSEQIGQTGNLSVSDELSRQMKIIGKRSDEIGKTTFAFSAMISMFAEKSIILEQIAQGVLTTEVIFKSNEDSMGVSLKRMADYLNNILRDIDISAEQVASASEQVAQAAQTLATGSIQQAASIERFSTSLNNLMSRVENNATNATKSLGVTSHAGVLMAESVQAMNEMLSAMNGIDESSQSIKRVIKVIDDIAFQTNILALNAAVEAARAGQHGKGFAVVADEVRNLASKSAAAAKETAELIEESSCRVAEGNQIVTRTNDGLDAVGITAKDNLELIEEIVVASNKQTQEIADLYDEVNQISAVIHSTSTTAEQSSATAEEMSAQASILRQLVSRFKLKHDAAESSEQLFLPLPGKQ